MIPGTKMVLGGEEYILAPLSFTQLDEGRDKDLIKAQQCISSRDIFSKEYRDTMVRLVHASVSRNHPDVTEEKVRKILDIDNAAKTFRALLTVTVPDRAGEPAGEDA